MNRKQSQDTTGMLRAYVYPVDFIFLNKADFIMHMWKSEAGKRVRIYVHVYSQTKETLPPKI